MTLHPQYVIDERGHRRSVLLSVKEYQELLESAQDVTTAPMGKAGRFPAENRECYAETI